MLSNYASALIVEHIVLNEINEALRERDIVVCGTGNSFMRLPADYVDGVEIVQKNTQELIQNHRRN
jgi:hypothetical protein